jgi:hypothetical protein
MGASCAGVHTLSNMSKQEIPTQGRYLVVVNNPTDPILVSNVKPALSISDSAGRPYAPLSVL